MREKQIEAKDVVIGDVIRCERVNEKEGTTDSRTGLVNFISAGLSFKTREGYWFGSADKDKVFFVRHVVHKLEPFNDGDWFKVDHPERKETFTKHSAGWWVGEEVASNGSVDLKMYKETEARYVWDTWRESNPEALSFGAKGE